MSDVVDKKDSLKESSVEKHPSCFGDYDPDHPKCRQCEDDYDDDVAEDCKCESGTECWICDNKDECGKYDDC